MSISVVMTTFNGEKYIYEQIDSLYQQDIPIDEMLIFDDGSKDRTLEIINEYISKRRINNWKVIKNPVQLGWKRNFINAIDSASGDYVFPCDQDDIWYPDKISLMTAIMDQNDEIEVLASNFDIRNEDPKHQFVKRMDMDDSIDKVELVYHNIYNERPGCVYCIRKTFFNEIKHLWHEELGHDDFLWKISLLDGGLYIFNHPTIEYRRHLSNATKKNHSLTNRRADNEVSLEFFSYIKKDGRFRSSSQQEFIEKEILFCQFRRELLNDPKMWRLFRVGLYRNMYKTRNNFLGDFAFVLMPFLFSK